MPTITLRDNSAMFYRMDGPEGGAAPVIVLIHGLAERSEAWDAWLPGLIPDFRVVRPDLRGYGRSTPMPTEYLWRFEQIIEDLELLFETLGLQRFHLVGAKVGGTIAMRLAAKRPDLVDCLFTIGSPASLAMMAANGPAWIEMVRQQGAEAWARETAGGRFGSALSAERLNWWVKLMGSTPASTLQGFLKMVPSVDVTEDLPQIQAATLVITSSSKTAIGSVEDVRLWQRKIPNSRLAVIETDSYHVGGSHPEACLAQVRAFIDSGSRRVDPARSPV